MDQPLGAVGLGAEGVGLGTEKGGAEEEKECSPRSPGVVGGGTAGAEEGALEDGEGGKVAEQRTSDSPAHVQNV